MESCQYRIIIAVNQVQVKFLPEEQKSENRKATSGNLHIIPGA